MLQRMGGISEEMKELYCKAGNRGLSPICYCPTVPAAACVSNLLDAQALQRISLVVFF